MTAALCSTCISPLSSATWWFSLDSSPASQPAVFLVWIREVRGHPPLPDGPVQTRTLKATLTWQKIMAWAMVMHP